jgi:signal transduction histidine kinase/CheY-like chemotaxis protein
MRPRVREAIQGYCFAVCITIAATWLRVQLHEDLEHRVPFGFHILAVLITAWLVGVGPAVVALMLGVVSVAHYVVPPDGSLLIENPADVFTLVIYGAVSATAIALFHRLSTNQALTSQRSAENHELTARLRDADRRKDEFLALLAHELRNPLAPIRTGLELLEREGLDAAREKSVRRAMRRQLEQLVRIVGDLLDVSRFMRGQLELQCETIDVCRVVDMAIETVQPMVDEQGHDLRFLRPREPVYIRGDHLRLTQVLANLLTNAAKYTPRGGRIRITVEVVGGEVQVQVIDNGIGISREAQTRIFDLFTQADTTNTREYGGLGLGLAIVKHLVALHSGVVEVRSEGPGRGSRFTVSFPIVASPVRSLADSGEYSLTRTIIMPPGTRILIVDDNRDAAETLAAVLAFEGFATFVADDGPSALQSFDNFQPQIVLLDLGMPGMDGYEIARRMRSHTASRQPRIVAVTGWGGEEVTQRTREAGIDHHLVKPVDVAELLRVVSGASEPALTAT